jgi:hypothetical protein
MVGGDKRAWGLRKLDPKDGNPDRLPTHLLRDGDGGPNMTSHDLAKQVEALGRLCDLYEGCLQSKAIRREAATLDAVVALGKSFFARLEILRDLYPSIATARKKLLATGYDVPNAWLTVRIAGEVNLSAPSFRGALAGPAVMTDEELAAVCDKIQADPLVLTDEGADVAGLTAVCNEIQAAILRLEVEQEAADTAPGPLPGYANLRLTRPSFCRFFKADQ